MKRFIDRLLNRSTVKSNSPHAAMPAAGDAQLAQRAFDAANVAREEQKFALAEKLYREAITLQSNNADAQCNLGSLLRDAGRLPEAENHLQIACQLDPACAPAAFNLAMVRIGQSRWSEAVNLLQRSTAISPSAAINHYWLGNALMGNGHSKAAQLAYKRAVRLDSNFLTARWGLVMAQLPAIADTEAEQSAAKKKFVAHLQEMQIWLDKKGKGQGYLAVGAQQPYYMAYIDGNHRDVLSQYGRLCCDEMATWRKSTALERPTHAPSRKIRLGIVSSHVCNHSVWHALIRGWVEHLSGHDFELHIFHLSSISDPETRLAQRKAFKFHQGLGPWQAWAQAVAKSGLDAILYPEVGMDASTMRLAALRLAPVQLAAWGHPLTTGLPTMDAFVTSEAFEPAESAQHYSERVLALPGLGSWYRPYGTEPLAVDLLQWGIGPDERLLLCPGTPMKYPPQHDHVWIAIAKQCAPCKLVFFNRKTDDMAQLLQARLRRAFEAAGVSFDDTVCFIPWQSQASFFGLLDRACAVLDTIGFSGFNTVMQAVERGTPLVAFEGAHMRGRFGSAIMRELGLPELVADTTDQFIALARRLMSDTEFNQSAREQISARRAAHFENADSVHQLGRHIVRLCRQELPLS